MGNIGRPSTGCYLCRKRRVKCDEGRPGCRNCARLKKPCPGYRELEVPFRNTVLLSAADVSRQSTPLSDTLPQPTHSSTSSTSTSGEDSDSSTSDSVLYTSSRLPYRPRPSKALSLDVTEQSVWYSLSQLDQSSRIIYGNTAFEFLSQFVFNSRHDSYIYAAMRAVGIVNLANRSPTVDMSRLVESEYSRAVSAVTSALADPVQYLRDETLVAVWLLGIRELLASISGPGRTSAHQTHVDGTLMLLRLRGEDQFSRPEGRNLFHTILSSMHWRPLFASEEPTQEYLILESQIPKALPRVLPATIKLQNFFHGVTKLRARIRNYLHLVQNGPSIDRAQTVNSYLRAAAKLEAKVLGWCDIESWIPRKAIIDRNDENQNSRNRPRYSPWTSGTLFRLHYFDTWNGFFHWNRFFVAKICLHAGLLDAISTLTNTYSDTNLSSHSTATPDLITHHTTLLHSTVRDFLGYLSYAFGDLDSNGCLRLVHTAAVTDGSRPADECRPVNVPATLQIQPPLMYLITLKYLGPGQREAMFLALQRIRAEFTLR